MTPDFARQLSSLARTTAQALVPAIGLVLCLTQSAQAQDNAAEDCAANDTRPAADCPPPGQGAAEAAPRADTLDWVPLSSVPKTMVDQRCITCGGRYIDPLAEADANDRPEDAPVEAITNSTELRGDTVLLSGGVEAVQGYRHLRADDAKVDRATSSAILTGNVTLREPGLLLHGERAEVYSRTGEAAVENSQFVLHERHLRGSADMLQRDTAGLLHVHEGSFSYCAPGENDWNIRASSMTLNLEEGLGTARNARVNVAGVPVFYTPWLQFPLDERRRTGLLWPDFGNDSEGGLDIATPIYFNLAPHYDALYAPRFIEKRGLNHVVKARYLNRYAGHWSVGGAYMNSDKHYEDQVRDGQSTDRWLTVVKQNGLFQQRWRSQVDYSKASDVDYLKDLETSNLNAQRRTNLLQLASLDYLGDRWLVNLDVQQFQSLADDINDDYKKLPQLTAQYRGTGTPFKLEPILVAQYSNFGSDEDRVTGQRIYSEAGATYPMLWNYGFVTPKAKYRRLDYQLDDGVFYNADNPSSDAALLSIDSGLLFDRGTRFAGKDLLQTLEPRLYYLYSQYDDQRDQPDFDSAELTFTYNQLFRETRFSGRDRLDDANQMSVGVTTRYIDREDGSTLLDASFGQIFYFRDRRVRLLPTSEPLDQSGSEMAAEVNFTPNPRFGLRSSLVWDPYSGNMNSGHVQAIYKGDDGSVYNLGYSYRRPLTLVTEEKATEEANISAYFPMGRNWRFFAAMNYSMRANDSVEDMFGVEYDTCCWKIRFLHLRYFDTATGLTPDFSNPNLERQRSTQVQILLKGMGGFGNRITDVLQDMIRGFEQSDY
ncbi:MAG: LPS-assembly protein LptD [Halioglobus sp.]|nr:LPS-assembly protein LptD [Halioglobus sp.]